MKNRLIRPASALFPASMAVCCAFMPDFTLRILLAYLAITLLSLCSAEAFRNAATREPSPRRVDRRFFGGLTMILLSTVIVSLICVSLGRWSTMYLAVLAGFALNIEQMFEERSYALGNAIDAPLMALVCALLTVGGALTKQEMFVSLALVAAALFALLLSLLRTQPQCFDPLPRNLGFFPKAALQSLLYPLVCIGLYLYNPGEKTLTAALIGGVLWRTARTPCRRTADEARQFNLFALTFTAVLLCLNAYLQMDSGAAALVSLLCVFAVYLTPTLRLCLGTTMLTAAFVCQITKIPAYVAYALCAAALLLNIKPATLTKRR